MTETAELYAPFKPILVDCSSANNGFTDCMVTKTRYGVMILGHAEMRFTDKEVSALIAALMAARDAPL